MQQARRIAPEPVGEGARLSVQNRQPTQLGEGNDAPAVHRTNGDALSAQRITEGTVSGQSGDLDAPAASRQFRQDQR